MSKRKYNKKNEKTIKYESANFTKEQMIEIQSEAYYRALKRIEAEKIEDSNVPNEQQNSKWNEDLKFILNVVFWPWKISKRFQLSDCICDSILVLIVSIILKSMGVIIWLFSSVYIATIVGQILIGASGLGNISYMMFGVLGMMIGSFLFLGGKEFSKENDSNKIYAYSACIIALISCVIGIITLFGK